jgi:hypothetical protein
MMITIVYHVALAFFSIIGRPNSTAVTHSGDGFVQGAGGIAAHYP